MSWLSDSLDQLAKSPVCDYTLTAPGASEPSALAELALVGHARADAAKPVGEFLLSLQSREGCIGMRRAEDWPQWPTSLAMLAWKSLDEKKYAATIAAAIRWTLSKAGERIEREAAMGHNSMLAAWPWVEGTHSWMEPSAFFTLALKAQGLRQHERTAEAVSLLIDRLLGDGGCNYGNTAVLGQTLRPHVQPSGIVMLALVGEKDDSGRILRTLDYLAKACQPELTPHSLAWAVLGLAAHDRYPANASELLAAAYEKTMQRTRSLYTLALLANAALGTQSLLITLPKTGAVAE